MVQVVQENLEDPLDDFAVLSQQLDQVRIALSSSHIFVVCVLIRIAVEFGILKYNVYVLSV